VLTKNAKYLFEDVINAIESIGQQNVFIVCMDGACKASLRLINEKYTKIFGQRCTTHAIDLLLNGIGRLFLHEIKLCTRLTKFVVNHGAVSSLLTEIPGTVALFTTCNTRFVSQIYSTEVILADKIALQSI